MTENKEVKYDKIGGWLILVVIGLVIAPFRLGYTMVTDFYPLISDREIWDALTTPDSAAYHPLWAPLLIFEMSGNILMIIATITILVFFFMRKKFIPLAMIILYVTSLLFVATDFFASDMIPAVAEQDDSTSLRELFKTALSTLIWVPYFIMSKRVKGTFVK